MARTNDDDVIVEKGASLARPIPLILGSILLAWSLLTFRHHAQFPPGSNFPDGTATGGTFLGIGANGWTAFFTAVAGGLLLFGAAQHLLSRTMSLIVGLALGACSVIALVDKKDVLGLAFANGWTKLAWGAAAALLLVNSLLPRIRHKREVPAADREVVRERPVREPAPAPVQTRPVETQRVETRPVETQRVETRPAQTQPVETRRVETRPVETRPGDTERLDSRPVETRRADGAFDDHDGGAPSGRDIVAEPGDSTSRRTEQLDGDLSADRRPSDDGRRL